MTGARPLRRSVGLILLLLTAVTPLFAAFHEAGHTVHASPLGYSSHDDAAHHTHRAVDGHRDCAVCAHAKSQVALAPCGPLASGVAPTARLAHPPAPATLSLALGALPAPRAPPASA
jgi:hypothetical protein